MVREPWRSRVLAQFAPEIARVSVSATRTTCCPIRTCSTMSPSHWGMTMAVYPFFGLTAEIMGRLLRLAGRGDRRAGPAAAP